MRVAFFGGVTLAFVVVCACSVQTALPAAVTCSVTVQSQNGACDLIAAQQCSDTQFYAIDCQDDATCTCVLNSNVVGSILAADQRSGYCATLDTSKLHDLSVKCGWNLNA